MALSSIEAPMLIHDTSLQHWKVIGSGGFGQIYKSRHLHWGLDVAVKLLHHDDGSSSSLLVEANLMRQGSSPHVLRVLGVYQGHPPTCGPSSSIQLGLVMEFMERGCLASLQESLRGPAPWPLAFRLAHQVALGMNFLHSLSPPLLHLDLKPSNVLLDTSLNAKLTDFGLARYCHSVTRLSKKDRGEEAGTISYMPPEAFTISYRPTRASDIYSYGILLWSIVTGEQPYCNAFSSVVRFRIPQGDRPSLDAVDRTQPPGLGDLVDLMERCWVSQPDQRPPFLECIAVTEALYEMHKPAINNTLHGVLEQLDQIKEEERIITEGVTRAHITQPPDKPVRVSNSVLTGPLPVQEIAGSLTANQKDKQSVKGQPSPRPRTYTDPVQASASYKTEVSSSFPKPEWKPIQASASYKAEVYSCFPKPERKPMTSSPSSKTMKKQPPCVHQNQFEQYQRQSSTPKAFPQRPHPPVGLTITMSNVRGLQLGDNNHMYIHTTDSHERRRHPTAPPSVNLPPPQSRSHRDKS